MSARPKAGVSVIDRWILSLLDRVPDRAQLPLLGSGVLLAGAGAWELHAVYPLGFQMEPFVRTPFFVWSTFWLGVGLVAVGLGLPERGASVVPAGFTGGQRSGLVASGLVLGSPFPLLGLDIGLGVVLFLIAIPSGVVGLGVVFLWRVGEGIASLRNWG